ncbi:helix-turn-helix domain-containing protein [Salmonella enterica subsp. enterica]|uniref:Arabinose operon regulatory protein n=1 Tax=Salmonella enterica subsp. enterica serovar Macclesfield str. S-1643 TaxID=1242107 RepID=A0A2C9NZS8_SALET|nr:helix-turn-helix domain-containing protein [Salmonella enterica]EAA5484935.1 helix-turn-helix domain-containing protein [Salmonella enterica subsp. enterica serovar Kouka]EBG2393306.1 helix-turn-helix domain-containing protein [Salmonella enterica subsp. enterica serovar Everleigh]EBS1110035.1 helix-turn-helix domain-containing protein [Salmonella enterica subsp. enterica serovar Eingedi]EBV2192649.1 helix-turn-helix domain-containing protein [Salmonella enterica subsp. enterica serovar Aful
MNLLTVDYYFPSVNHKLALYSSDPEDNSSEHCHEFDELVIVEEGHGLHVINDNPLYIQQGDVFYVQAGDHHFYDELGTLKLINILINPHESFHYLQKVEPLLHTFCAREAACYGWLSPDTRMQCRLLIEKIFSLRLADDAKCALREASFFQLVTTILHAQTEAEYNNTRYKLHKLLTYLQENCFQEHDWHSLATQFHLTTRTTFRHIKEATGLTPDSYLKRLRLVSARVKLRETEISITEIAYMCGFSNSNHFTTLYKKVFGITPSDERRRT